ncbi:MAG: glycosyltransferase [Marinoscillum sp.]|uniref:glycosyltransferase family 2 protein n=1 Tax=Marinoscillum sp. TaxID=2024838 RepID=UPI0032F342D5
MDSLPLVSIICLCYNQKAFVGAAIRSALAQTYQNIEIIVVDDGSADGSKEEISASIKGTAIRFIDLPKNIGNCAAFNAGYRASTGEYLIDLAADDLLLPTRVELGINDFANGPDQAGVHFSDAFITDESGSVLKTHYPRNQDGQMRAEIPAGNIYENLIRKYFICPPTMMIRRRVFDDLEGYDESLSYEDFDFWIRSGRTYEYLFNPAPLVKKRVVKNSLSTRQFGFRSRHLASTYRVCEKIFELNQKVSEDQALIRRCRYEIRQCVKTFNFELILKYGKIIGKTQRRLSSLSSMER